LRFAILGGSFNPVHIGHLFLAEAALTGLGYDRLILVPAFQSPFKLDAETASPQDRLDMLAASIAADPRLTIDDCEIRRAGVSYTIDTIRDIRARYRPDGKAGLILGDDLADSFSRWLKAGEIAKEADIILARRLRSGSPVNFPYPHKILGNEIMDISSRLIREKLHRGENWRYLVPQAVRWIIEDRGLYLFAGDREGSAGCRESPVKTNRRGCCGGRTPAEGGGAQRANEVGTPTSLASVPQGGDFPPIRLNQRFPGKEIIAFLEDEVRRTLSPSRFAHSRNTALLAWDLCGRFGLDREAGYLAGIAHDICKSMSPEELVKLVREDGEPVPKGESGKNALLHARAGAVWLRKRYNIREKEILDAVRYHTTGNKDMGPLAKVIYIADKIEMSREEIDPALRDMAVSADLETLFQGTLKNTVAWLRSQSIDISWGTRRLLAAMQREKP
jgi:nicotinate-nucleotide adenylyltransferase